MSEKIFEMLDLFYANKHLYEKIRKRVDEQNHWCYKWMYRMKERYPLMEIKLQEMTEEELRKLQDLILRENKRRKREKIENYQTRLSALLKEMRDDNVNILFDYEYKNFRIEGFYIDNDNDIIAEYDEY